MKKILIVLGLLVLALFVVGCAPKVVEETGEEKGALAGQATASISLKDCKSLGVRCGFEDKNNPSGKYYIDPTNCKDILPDKVEKSGEQWIISCGEKIGESTEYMLIDRLVQCPDNKYPRRVGTWPHSSLGYTYQEEWECRENVVKEWTKDWPAKSNVDPYLELAVCCKVKEI